jgi:hypothetical protein
MTIAVKKIVFFAVSIYNKRSENSREIPLKAFFNSEAPMSLPPLNTVHINGKLGWSLLLSSFNIP